MIDAIQLRKGEGYVLIPIDQIRTVECDEYRSRNLSCVVNGISVNEGYDFVVATLGWNPVQIK